VSVAHIGGVPVEETLQPVIIMAMLAGAWLSTRLRRPRRSQAATRRRS
jgi:hypothetical protein